jgi:hypothetical protein
VNQQQPKVAKIMESSSNILYTRRLKAEAQGVVGWTDLLERRARRLAYKRWWNAQHPGHWKKWPSSNNLNLRRKSQKLWKQRNPDAVRADSRKRSRQRVQNVTLTYLRNHWANKWGLKNVPVELLEAHGTLIKIQRQLKTYGKTKRHQ